MCLQLSFPGFYLFIFQSVKGGWGDGMGGIGAMRHNSFCRGKWNLNLCMYFHLFHHKYNVEGQQEQCD